MLRSPPSRKLLLASCIGWLSAVLRPPCDAGFAAFPGPFDFSPFMSPAPVGGLRFGVLWDCVCGTSLCKGEVWFGDDELLE